MICDTSYIRKSMQLTLRKHAALLKTIDYVAVTLKIGMLKYLFTKSCKAPFREKLIAWIAHNKGG